MIGSRPLHKIRKLHLVGVGGAGMSGIAEVLHTQGFNVSGSDTRQSPVTDRLKGLGVEVEIGHRPENVVGADVVVHSSAVGHDNSELVEAKRLGVPVIGRPEMLGELTRIKFSIGISGTHGKTTTTSMVGQVLTDAGAAPTIIVGGVAESLGAGGILGRGAYLVVEADEYDRTFLRLFPTIAVVTSIEEDHFDCYSDIADIKDAFAEYLSRVPFFGTAVLCWDDENVRSLIPDITTPVVTYGTTPDADIWADDIVIDRHGSRFNVKSDGETLGDVFISTPGLHNVRNALAALAVATDLDVSFAEIRDGLAAFSGVDRRFQILGSAGGVTVIDDFAHLPSELSATLATARQISGYGRLVTVFQPHLFSRTRDFQKQFGQALLAADTAIVTDIYPSREAPIEGVTSQLVTDRAKDMGHTDVRRVSTVDEAQDAAMGAANSGDVVVTMGAGSVGKVGRGLLDALRQAEVQ